MEEKFKNLLLKDIERRVKSVFNDDYKGHIDEINRYFFKLYGRKERILLETLTTYANSLNVDNELFLASLIDIFDINVITDLILNNLIRTNDVRENIWRELISESSSKPLLFKFLNQTTTNPFIKFRILLNLMVKANPLTFYRDVIEIIVKIFKYLTEKYEFLYILDVLNLEKNLKKLPNFFIEEIKKYIDSLTFEEQVKLKQIYKNIPKDFFTKIKESDYIIIGRPDVSGVIMVKNLDYLYGYIDKNEELIIPTVFDEISSVNKRGLIVGKVNIKRGEVDRGIYKMDTTGKIVEILPS